MLQALPAVELAFLLAFVVLAFSELVVFAVVLLVQVLVGLVSAVAFAAV